jgi:hypothetical protein
MVAASAAQCTLGLYYWAEHRDELLGPLGAAAGLLGVFIGLSELRTLAKRPEIGGNAPARRQPAPRETSAR